MIDPIERDPTYGYFPWWPEDGDGWLHPEDVEQARTLIPSPRIFKRDGSAGDFDVLQYGDVRLRVRPALWKEVRHEGFQLGDWVEVLSRGMKNTPRTAVIREMLWDDKSRALRYQIRENDKLVPNYFTAEDLRHVEPTLEN